MLKKGQNNNSKKGRSDYLLKFSVLLLILICIVGSLIFLFKYQLKQNSKNELNGQTNQVEKVQISNKKIVYKSEMFKYKIEYPESLLVREMGSGGGYIDFVRFEEQSNSQFKGFAIGVSEQNLTAEVARIKMAFNNEKAFLAEEKSINYKGYPAKQLYYKPEEVGEMEDRLIIIFNNGKYTYSISTSPWQLKEVTDRFELLN